MEIREPRVPVGLEMGDESLAEQFDLPETIEGVRCSLEVHCGHGARALSLQCPNGCNCEAYRSFHLRTAEFGSSAAFF